MKKILLFFAFLFVVTLNAAHWSDFYHIDGDTLVSAQGKRFPALNFGSALHEELAYRMKDPEQAEIIYRAYQKHVEPILSGELVTGFSNALVKVCYLFGSRKFSPEKGVWIGLREEGCALWAEGKRQAIADFISEANQPAHKAIRKKMEGPLTIAILTTSASGGNESVARGVMNLLSEYKTVLIDVETLAREADLVALAGAGTTYDGLYASEFQQKEDWDFLIQRDVVTKELGKYIPSRLGSLLKEKLLEIGPDLIISTRNYTVDDLCLATLDVPFRILHCDYELSVMLLDAYGKVDANVKFWLPGLEPAVFKPLFVRAGRIDLYDEGDGWEALREKVAFLLGITSQEVCQQFECMGYPIRSEFMRIEDCEGFREKWDVGVDEVPILISMGKNGVGAIEKVFDQLIKLPEHGWKFIFICGKNEELKSKLESGVSSSPNNRFAICGFLSAVEMNELMHLAPLMMTKAGGAVVSEALVTQTYLLMTHSHPWEEANGAKIEREGMGQQVRDDVLLEAQIEDALAKAKVARCGSVPDWKSLLLNELLKEQEALEKD